MKMSTEHFAHYSDSVKETEPALGDQRSLKLCIKYSCTRALTSWGRGSKVSRTSQGSTISQKFESLTCFLNSKLLENDLLDIGDDYMSVNLLKTLELYTLNG